MNIVTFSHLGLHGRFGNQLFQIAAVIGAAAKLNARVIIPSKWAYREYFNIPDLFFGEPVKGSVINTGQFHYKEDYLKGVSGNIDLYDYFQSEKYFSEVRDIVKNYLFPKGVTYLDKWSVGIHIRRGDYVDNDSYVQYPPEYYFSAIEKYFNDERYTFYICTDDPEYARFHFHGDQFKIEERSVAEDFKLLVGCGNMIICNSSFSWWGAYLSNAKTIIRPPKIFSERLAHYNEDDFWMPGWIVHDDFKIPLKDVTFIIPVKYDHKDRKENLDLCVKLLTNAFDTNIIIGEQGFVHKFSYYKDKCRYVHFSYYNEFHRTKMLNRMTELAETPFVVNWDSDVFVSPGQILEMTKMLRGGYDFAYPYDGRFSRMGREWYPKIKDDLGIVRGVEFPGMESEHLISYGGGVGYNKESFIKAGMENEKFISYGPEDFCRYKRFNIFGKVGRTYGCLYHLNHYCGVDSNSHNPHFNNNNKEWHKNQKMSDAEFKAYVKTWPWTDSRKIVLVLYSDENYESQKRVVTSQAYRLGYFDQIFSYDRQWLIKTDFYKKNKKLLDEARGGGYWLWKPYCILETLAKINEGDYVVYMDSGDVFTGKEDLRTYLLQSNQDIILTRGVHKQFEWTKKDCFIKMGCDEDKYWNSVQLEAGIFVCRKTKSNLSFLSEWLQWCCQEQVVSDLKSVLGDEMDGFIEHRHDQSILTNLSIKYNLNVSSDMRKFIECNAPPRDELQGITFVIPLFYDGKDRVRNVETVLAYLSKFNCCVIVGEQLDRRFNYLKVDKYIHFDYNQFHRTRMINEMIMASETDIVVICDADVIVPEKQLNEAMALMLEGEVDVLYPFNSFVKLNRIQTSSLMSSMNYDSYSSIGGMHSVGGMIFFKKSSYMEGGMENEKFMVWGYEDVERYERFRKLGYNIVRLDGNLYHLHHHIGPNSSRLNPFFGSNKAEYEKVLKMDKEQLLDYIETWGWRF